MGLIDWRTYAWLNIFNNQQTHNKTMEIYERMAARDMANTELQPRQNFGGGEMSPGQAAMLSQKQEAIRLERETGMLPRKAWAFDYPAYWQLPVGVGLTCLYFGRSYTALGIVALGAGILYLVPALRKIGQVFLGVGCLVWLLKTLA